jgi:hypothetical protein
MLKASINICGGGIHDHSSNSYISVWRFLQAIVQIFVGIQGIPCFYMVHTKDVNMTDSDDVFHLQIQNHQHVQLIFLKT